MQSIVHHDVDLSPCSQEQTPISANKLKQMRTGSWNLLSSHAAKCRQRNAEFPGSRSTHIRALHAALRMTDIILSS